MAGTGWGTVEIFIGPGRASGTWRVEGGMLIVIATPPHSGSKQAQLGRLPAEILAARLLREIVTEEKRP